MNAYIDANVFLLARFGTGRKSEAASKIIEGLQSGNISGTTCSLTLDEVMWAIIRQKQGNELREVVEDIYALPNLNVVDTPAHAPLRALEFIRDYNLRPRDAIHAAVMTERGITAIYSDDEDFDRIKGVKRKF